MKKYLHVFIAFSGISVATISLAATKPKGSGSNLQSELSDLKTGGFGATANEKMYVVQDRHLDLTNKWQLSLGAGRTVNPNIYVTSDETAASLRYYLNNRWFLQMDGASVSNGLTTSAERIWQTEGLYPDTSYIERKFGGALGLNVIYGKARITQDFMFYFDQFLTLGGAVIEQNNGAERIAVPGVTAEAGFSFSMGRYFSLLMGVKDTYFQEKRRTSSSNVHQVVAYSGVGLLLGGKA